jgi:hypothetical protein
VAVMQTTTCCEDVHKLFPVVMANILHCLLSDVLEALFCSVVTVKMMFPCWPTDDVHA